MHLPRVVWSAVWVVCGVNRRYEEVLRECVCPPALVRLLKWYWSRRSPSGEFSTLREVLKDDEENVLCTTVYRGLVLWFSTDVSKDVFDSNVGEGVWADG